MKAAIGQINPIIGDFKGNVAKIYKYIERARSEKVDIIVFPEMCLCGYPPMDLLEHSTFVKENKKALRKVQQQTPEDLAVVVGYVTDNPALSGKPLLNAASLLLNGRIELTQAKTLLPTFDVFDEARYFEPAIRQELFNWKGYRIGIAICEDLWWETEPVPGARYPVDPVNKLLDMGMTFLAAPSASPFHYGKLPARKKLLSKISSTAGIPTLYANTVGGNDNLIFDGNSIITVKDGACAARALAFEEDFISIEVDSVCADTEIAGNKYEEIFQALVLGVRDYLRKTGFSDVHLGLSGGIDSALVAVIAVDALGAEHVTCFALPSSFSSEGSLTDSKKLAENLGCSYEILPIESVFKAYNDSLTAIFEGMELDITEENLQARIRGTLLMAFSNKYHSLLLATGNKSEFATGYCTLYGDMCGGLAVIGDLLKTEVYALCRYINKEEEVIPGSILTKPPSAELRPNQTDQDTLPPYDVLDEILQYYVLENKTKEDIVEKGYDAETVGRVLTMVARAEYKRRQAPPVLKISPRAFGTGRRVPLARNIYES